ncbi:MAG: hypothetical protein DMF60_02860 [Acidobacteria bacterium]|nr:MAG: hypothetical protein DMF60_02860 [Acidobacteriota bacterium]
MIRATRILAGSALLLVALFLIPSNLISTSSGKDGKENGKVKAPDKPNVETVVLPGEASPVRCKGHILHPGKKN